MQFGILGPLEIVGSDGPLAVRGAKRRGLVAYLLVHAGEAVSLDRLVEDLWDERSSSGARGTVQTYLSQLRKLLADSSGVALETRPGGYTLAVPAEGLDARCFERLCAQAATEPDATTRLALLDDAFGLWRGEPLGEFAGSAWADVEATRLRALRLQALQQRIDARLDLGHHAKCIPELERLVREHSLDEHLWAQLMVAYYRSGRQADALRTFGRLRGHLGEELGIEPSKELVRLEEAILFQKAELDWEASEQAGRPASETLPSGVVTFLLTDIVGSTALWERHPKTMADAVVGHDVLMHDAVIAHGGTVLKARGEGDSTFSVFTRATDALDAALSAQRALVSEAWPESTRLSVRMALHTGEVFERDGDYYGPTVNRAARIRSLGAGGQILLSQSAGELVRDDLPEQASLVDLGSHVLSDLTRAEQISGLSAPGLPECPSLGAETLEGTAGVSVPVPGVLRDAAGEVFVGRGPELEALTRAWKDAGAGERRAVLIGGEPGVGKTRLAAQLATIVAPEGAGVLYGRCDEDLGIPYQPWVEALRHLIAHAPRQFVADQVARHGGQLARLVPELSQQDRDPPAMPGNPDAERYLLFGAVVGLLARLSTDKPVLLVLEDLHWADKPSLLLLRHLIASTDPRRLLVVGTYRQTDLGADHPLSDVLAAMHRHKRVQRIDLSGLTDTDVVALLQVAAGDTLDDTGVALAHALYRETDGNPFFTGEILRHLAETGLISERDGGGWTAEIDFRDEARLPTSVREVIGRRVARLGEEAERTLRAAAVIGRAFELDLLSRVMDQSEDHILDVLDRAIRAVLIRDTAQRPGCFSFSHALIEHTLYDDLGPARRQRLHLRVGEALETLCDARAGDRLGELAYHFGTVAGGQVATKAFDYARRAGHRALQLLAYEEAANLYVMALDALEYVSAPHDRARCELLLELADAYLRAGDVAAAQTRALEASDLAAQLEEPSLIVGAALVYGYADSRAVEHGETAAQLLRDALPLADDQATRVRVRAALGRSLAISGKVDEGRALSEEALADARELEDAETLKTAFNAVLYASESPDSIERQVDLARDFTEFARGRGDVEAEVEAGGRLLAGTISLGDLDEARARAERQQDLIRQSGQPLFRVVDLQVHALLAMGEGRFVEAQAMATEANELALVLSGSDAPGGYGVQLFSIRREQGRLDEARPIVESVARLGQEGATWGPALAVLYADLGMTDEAAGALRHLVPDGLRAVPRDTLWLASLSYLADTCVAVGDADAAHVVYRELLPYRGLIVRVGMSLAAYGATDRYLGALAALLARGRDAETHFEAALRIDARAHMPVWLAHTQLAYGRFLMSRARRGDFEQATSLLHAALETAQTLGMATVAATATAELDRSRAPARQSGPTRT